MLVAKTCIFSLIISIALLLPIKMAAAESHNSWIQLTSDQQDALQPLAIQWNSLPDKLQIHLLHAANRYQKLTPEKKIRFQSRLEKWSKLTPEQREHARINYLSVSKAPLKRRVQLRQKTQDQELGKPVASGVPPNMPVH